MYADLNSVAKKQSKNGGQAFARFFFTATDNEMASASSPASYAVASESSATAIKPADNLPPRSPLIRFCSLDPERSLQEDHEDVARRTS